MKVILPTGDIVREFKALEPILSFYDGGIRGLIREAIRSVSEPECRSLDDFALEQFCNNAIEIYENSIERQFIENTYNSNYPAAILELALARIADLVWEMMFGLFASIPCLVDAFHCRWIGDDLMITIKLPEPANAPRTRVLRIPR